MSHLPRLLPGHFATQKMKKQTHPKADSPHDELRPSDAAHERHIKHLGEQMLQHHERWAATSCFAARGSADGYRLQMEAAIGQRSPQAIAFMEAERGLV